MSVHNEYTGYTLKHLLLRHMYNLSLPNLCATCSSLATLRLPTAGVTDCYSLLFDSLSSLLCALYCAVPYTAACVDASRTVFSDHSVHCKDSFELDCSERSKVFLIMSNRIFPILYLKLD